MRILLADDHADLRDSTKILLELEGHHVDLARNGQEAVDLATERVPDVIFMDLRMPRMDGLTATRLLRSRRETKQVPIICISAYLRQSASREQAFDAGCNECLLKPIDHDNLAVILTRLERGQ
jgi:CheY-like chemotaxis protein